MEKISGFVPWHYSTGLEFFVNSWIEYFNSINHYFSLTLLPKTLFAPWKRLVDEEQKPGFDISRSLEKFMFNAVSSCGQSLG